MSLPSLLAGILASLALLPQTAGASTGASLTDGALLVRGDALNNDIAVRLNPTDPDQLQVVVEEKGARVFTFPRAAVTSIDVRGGAGDDNIHVDQAGGVFTTTIPTTLEGNSGDDAIIGGSGNETILGGAGDDFADGNIGSDTIDLGRGDDTNQWDPGDGSDKVDGSDGFDTLAFNGAAIAERFAATPNGSRVRFARDIGNVTMDLGTIERIALADGAGADTLTVDDLHGTDLQVIDNDLAADDAPDTTVVNGTNNADTIAVSGTATRTVTGNGVTVNVRRADATGDGVTINTFAGVDRVDASRAGAGPALLTMNTGTGNDTMLGSAGNDTFVWNPGDGSDVEEGGLGRDTMLFNGANIAEKFDVSANGRRVRFTRDIGGVVMDANSVEEIDLNALGGADSVTLNDTTGTGLQELKTDLASAIGGATEDGAADTVTVNGTAVSDVIQASGNASGTSVTGLATRVDMLHANAAQDLLSIFGLGGDDVVNGSGLTADAIRFRADGGEGADDLIGGAGNDTLLGGEGDDILNGGPGQDVLDGGTGNNVVIQ